MLLMVMFYWAEQQEASCNMQKQNKAKAMQDKTSNTAIKDVNRKQKILSGNW